MIGHDCRLYSDFNGEKSIANIVLLGQRYMNQVVVYDDVSEKMTAEQVQANRGSPPRQNSKNEGLIFIREKKELANNLS